MFDPIWKLVLGFATGIAFGMLLQKGGVAKFRIIVGQFILQDWTVVKIMGTAVIAGAIGVYGLLAMDVISLHIQPLAWGGIVVGGLCFGIGMAVFGYCPGTSVAACGEGRRDAMVGVFGMFLGAGAYVAFFPKLDRLINGFGDAGKVTIPQLTETSPWLWITGLAITAVAIYLFSRARATRDSAAPEMGAVRSITSANSDK